MSDSCPLCHIAAERIFYDGKAIIGAWEDDPVTPGHVILATRRHVTDWFAASPVEQLELVEALTLARDVILERHLPDGFNIGIHIGQAAGQIISHVQVHVIPRYRKPDAREPAGRGEASGRSAPVGTAAAREDEQVLARIERELDRTPAASAPEPAKAPHARARTIPFPARRAVTKAVQTEQDPAPRQESPAPAPASNEPAEQVGAESPAATAASERGDEQDRQDGESPAEQQVYQSLDGDEVSPTEGSDEYLRSSYDYDDDYLYDEDDDEDYRARPGRKKWLVPLVLVVLGGGGYFGYRVMTSPYIGEPPAHLKVKALPARKVAAAKAKPTPKPPPLAPAAAEKGAAPAAGEKPPPSRSKLFVPPNPASQGEYAALMAEATKLMKGRKRGKAFRLFKKALAVNPDGWEALQHLAWRDFQAGRSYKGYKQARKALKLNADAPYAHLVIGSYMHEKDRAGAARGSYRKFVKLCPACREVGAIRQVLRSMSEQ